MGQKPFALYHRKGSGARQNHDFIGVQGVPDFRRQGLGKEGHAIEANDGDWVPVPFPLSRHCFVDSSLQFADRKIVIAGVQNQDRAQRREMLFPQEDIADHGLRERWAARLCLSVVFPHGQEGQFGFRRTGMDDFDFERRHFEEESDDKP
jgi:hypothetical protein